jgi:hypothetical protein
MDFLIGIGIGFIAGGISVSIWLKVTGRLIAKVTEKIEGIKN